MFLEHGSFQLLELAIKKRSTLSNSRSKQGGRFTKLKLEKNEAYSKNMIAKAWQWAKAQGKLRVNEVHGEEEIYIVANETFDVTTNETEEAEQSGAIEAFLPELDQQHESLADPASIRGSTWLATSMNHQLEKMQGLYEKLAALLSEAAVAPESLDKSKRDEIQSLFVQCTKLDVGMNSLLAHEKLIIFRCTFIGLCSEKCRAMRHTYTTRMLYTVLPSERLQNYPRGLGKGSDTAVMGAWLDTVLQDLTPDRVPDAWCMYW
ncbi:Uncharacterized protein SCF082_LOCUS12104 [Durusdinium trenchii]|uniref:Uncharacterized protein n=1 Tax=Durusdinium trenchii TaxID=1381693 RepID=A0ABP0JHG6_9DINO